MKIIDLHSLLAKKVNNLIESLDQISVGLSDEYLLKSLNLVSKTRQAFVLMSLDLVFNDQRPFGRTPRMPGVKVRIPSLRSFVNKFSNKKYMQISMFAHENP